MRAHRKLEEPAEEGGAGLSPESERAIPDEGVASIPTIRKAVAHKIEANRTKAGIQEVLQNDVFCVLGTHRAHRELHASCH